MYKSLSGVILALAVSSSCTSNNSRTCGNDYDCLENEVCESGYCKTTPSPQEPLTGFISSLDRGDLESALNYISDKNKSVFRQVLSQNGNLPIERRGYHYGKSMQEIANFLRNVNLHSPSAKFGKYTTYEFTCSDSEGNLKSCTITFIKENGTQKIENL